MNQFELYRDLDEVSLEEFGSKFGNIKEFAFRLELLQQFIVDDEIVPFERFLSGEGKPPKDYNKGWCDLIRTNARKGVNFRRVRYLVKPLSDYTKFEIAWPYRVNVEAGEDIRIIEGPAIPSFAVDVPILKDYWVFDDSECFLMEYDNLGKFLGVKRLPVEYLPPYIALMNETLRRSVSISQTEYLQ